jgi:catechol 2,3-dioxygenase-like lactoylglutathione lyase family enzyme
MAPAFFEQLPQPLPRFRADLSIASEATGHQRMEAIMFETAKAFGSFAVDDLAGARKFYGETLGLRLSEEGGPLMLYVAGDQRILVYPKADHSPASFTILNFPVDDIDQAVDELTARGVPIQRYEGLATDGKGIYRSEGHSIAWFTDPAGNVLSVVQEG